MQNQGVLSWNQNIFQYFFLTTIVLVQHYMHTDT